MTSAYINYPNPHITIHFDTSCPQIQKMRKVNQRRLVLSRDTFDDGLRELSTLRLRAEAGFNDLWLTVDFGNQDFEEAVVRYAREVLGKRYSPLKKCRMVSHC